MKIAILSDIHGNFVALNTVLEEAKRQKVEHLFLLGDQLGYFYQADKVFEAIGSWSHNIISGNHERLFLEYLDATEERKTEIDEKYGYCFKYYEEHFLEEQIEKIRELPEKQLIEKEGYVFLLCHGTVNNKDEYIYPDVDVEKLEENDIEGVHYVFNGHTHYPMIYKGKYSLFINVGSVGQSRTIGGIANWGIINTKNGVYISQSTPYKINDVIENLEKNKERKEYLFEVLKRNNKNYEG